MYLVYCVLCCITGSVVGLAVFSACVLHRILKETCLIIYIISTYRSIYTSCCSFTCNFVCSQKANFYVIDNEDSGFCFLSMPACRLWLNAALTFLDPEKPSASVKK